MIRTGLTLLLLMVLPLSANAQKYGFIGKEPDASELGAPMYPGAVFIRTISSLDPYYESSLYVTHDTSNVVRKFFKEKLPDTRVITYEEEFTTVWSFLLKEWIPLPENPDRDELTMLDSSPTLRIHKYQKVLYEPLVEYLESTPDSDEKVKALNDALSIITYTYQKIYEDVAQQKVVGTWKNVDRDLLQFYGSVLEVHPDSTYTLTLTEDNMRLLMSKSDELKKFNSESPDGMKIIDSDLTRTNPETGRISVMWNTIILQSENPAVGVKIKTGLAKVGATSMSLQFINMPRLTFLRSNQ